MTLINFRESDAAQIWLGLRNPPRVRYLEYGGMAEWLKAAVLKTVNGVTRSGVRIPLPPPETSSAVPKPFARTRPLAQGGALPRQPAFRAAAREGAGFALRAIRLRSFSSPAHRF